MITTFAMAIALLQAVPMSDEVTVTGRPLPLLRDAWRACIEQGCPPEVEIRRAMDYAEAQLVTGDYAGGWRTVRTTKRRTFKHADLLPLDVAQISRATGRMASLNGEATVSRINSVEAADALRAGLSSNDARVLLAQLDIADGYVPELQYDFALAKYARVGQAARKRGYDAIAAEAAYRRAGLLVSLAQEIGMYRASARREIDAIIASDDRATAPYRDLARLTAVNLLPRGKRIAAVDALLPTLMPRPIDDLLLALGPPIPFDQLAYNPPGRNAAQQWLDIRYRITPDGRVHNASVARAADDLDPALRDAALVTIGNRRYAPLALPAGDQGIVNHVRVTFVFDPVLTDLKTRIVRRGGVPRVDMFDLGASLARRDAASTP